MTTYSKKTTDFLLSGLLALFAMVMLFIIFPASADAATGTLGTESPYVYCTYEQNGVAVDGNNLTAGEYDVKVHLTGMQNSSVFQVSAAYDETVVQPAKTASSLISDSNTDLDSMGYVLANGNIVFGFVSTRDDCTPLEEDSVIATVPMTFTQDCDAADYINISADPNYTFAQADYGDGYSNEYAPDTQNYPDYSGELYSMECDVTPELGHDVSGSIVVMTSSNGATADKAAYGEYAIKIYSDEARTNELTDKSTVSQLSVDASGNKINSFTVTGLVPGTYYASVSYDYAITRDVIITVTDNDITNAVISVVACDFRKDDVINGNDTRIVTTGSAVDSGYEFCDLNADGVVNGNDTRIVVSLAAGDLVYAPIEIKN